MGASLGFFRKENSHGPQENRRIGKSKNSTVNRRFQQIAERSPAGVDTGSVPWIGITKKAIQRAITGFSLSVGLPHRSHFV